MFTDQEIKPDTRPVITVIAPGHEFLLKYFDRYFDRRVVTDVSDDTSADLPVIVVGSAYDEVSSVMPESQSPQREVITLLLPEVVGTGMNGPVMRLARGLARGTLCKIKDNTAVWSVIHAVDVPRFADEVMKFLSSQKRHTVSKKPFLLTPNPTKVSDLIDALAHRMAHKRVFTIKPRWARLLYGKRLYDLLTRDRIPAKAESDRDTYPDFDYTDPVEYLTTHIYDDESL